MNIGIFVTAIAVPRGRESNISGHIQLPMRTCELLLERGHRVQLISNEHDPELVLPYVVPAPERVPLHFVRDGRRRGRVGMQDSKRGLRPIGLLHQLRDIKRLARELNLDVLHMFGYGRMASLGGVLNLLRVKPAVVATLFAAPGNKLSGGLSGRVDRLVASTDFVGDGAKRRGLNVQVIRPGIVRDLRSELDGQPTQPRHRVLFWREANAKAGGDLILDAFERLAPRFPGQSFDLAVRSDRFEVPGIDALAQRHKNVHLYRFPYPENVSLASLVAESLCVVLPFRELSIHPQLAVAESLLGGAATIASDIGSNHELVREGETGLLVPPDDADALTAAVEQLLTDTDRTLAMGEAARQDIINRWNWDGYAGQLIDLYEQAAAGR